MKSTFTHEEIKDALAVLYRDRYDSWFLLMEEAKAAIHDGDEDAHKAISRRADKRSDFMEGIMSAAEALGIEYFEFKASVNVDRAKEQ